MFGLEIIKWRAAAALSANICIENLWILIGGGNNGCVGVVRQWEILIFEASLEYIWLQIDDQ